MSNSLSETDETLIIIEAVREASIPKFLPEDVPLSEKIIGEVFPEATVSTINQIALEVIRPLKIVATIVEYQLR